MMTAITSQMEYQCNRLRGGVCAGGAFEDWCINISPKNKINDKYITPKNKTGGLNEQKNGAVKLKSEVKKPSGLSLHVCELSVEGVQGGG